MTKKDPRILKPHPLNEKIYGNIDTSTDIEFEKSIKNQGILSPVVIDNNNVIISGHRRVSAAINLGIELVPVEIRDFGSSEETELCLISFNKTRIKTYHQEMMEYDEEVRLRKAAELPFGDSIMLETRNESKGTFHRKKFLWNAAKEGDEKAVKLVERIKEDPRLTVAKAYNNLIEHRHEQKVKETRREAAKLGEKIKESQEIYLGDFSEVLDFIPNNTVDAIITDPPYPKEFIECWSKLGEFAYKKLRPGGWLVAYSGQRFLPEVFSRLEASGMTYYWTMALYHNGTRQDVWGIDLNVMWKPIIVYVKPNVMKIDNRGHDDYLVSLKEEKQGHDWQQSESSVATLIETFTSPNDLILEPFAGSGTTIAVGKRMNRRVIGAELSVENYNIAKLRIDATPVDNKLVEKVKVNIISSDKVNSNGVQLLD